MVAVDQWAGQPASRRTRPRASRQRAIPASHFLKASFRLEATVKPKPPMQNKRWIFGVLESLAKP